MATSVGAGDSLFNHVKWDNTNRSTSFLGKIAFALAVITILGAAATLIGHGHLATIGSDFLVGGGAATILAGVIYIGCKIRDWREKKQATIAWDEQKDVFKQDMEKSLKAMQEGEAIINRRIKLKINNKDEKYFATIHKDTTNILEISKQPKVIK